MKHVRSIASIMLMAFFLSVWSEVHAHNVEFTIDAQHTDYGNAIDDALPPSFYLKKLTYESDVHFQEAEFRYLMDMSEEKEVTTAQFKEGLFYLRKKRQFKTINVSIQRNDDGYAIHLRIKGGWVLRKIIIHGIIVGKDRYKHYYTVEPGELFDSAAHERSLRKIQEVCSQEGYYNARIKTRLDYDEDCKTITVHLWLSRNKQFSIEQVNLDVQGDVHIDQQEQQLLHTKVKTQFFQKLQKGYYSKQFINEQCADLKRYLTREGYADVDIELSESINRKKNAITLSLTIRLHRKRLFVFIGNSFFSHDQLLNSALIFGRSSPLLPASFLSEEIIKIYKNKGFWDVTVETREELQRYFFIIKEGVRAQVTDVLCQGIKHTVHEDVTKRYFAKVLKAQWYDEDTINAAIDDLVNWYVSEGFLECRVTKREYVACGDHRYQLVITLEEGVWSHWADVSIKGYPELSDSGPFRVITRKKERIPFTMQGVQEQRTWLLNYFRSKGFLFITLNPDIKRDEDAVTLCWHVDNGAQEATHFGKIVVQGAGNFPFSYIMREMQFNSGELWDRDKIKTSLEKLKRLDVFESVQVQPYDMVKHEREKAVLVKVQRDERFEARMRAGFALQQVSKQFTFYKVTYRAGGSFWIKNPFNCGDRLSLDIDSSLAERKMVAEYHRPWLGSIPIDTVVQVYDNQFQQPGAVGNRKNLYQVNQIGSLFGLRKAYDHINFGGNIGFEWMETITGKQELFADRVARAIDFEPYLLDRKIPYFMCEPSVTVDYVDNRLNPSKGVFMLYSLKSMIPLDRLGICGYFVRLTLEQSFYIPVDPVVLAFRIRLGHIFHKDFSSIMPSERFYLGGANSLRGYERDLAPPLGIFHDEKRGPQYVPQGGKSMANVILELRFPIYKQFGMVIFEDIGVLSSNAFYDFKERGILSSTGFGFRYETPIGPLRFDLGWRWKATDPIHPSFAWFLTLGQAF